MGSIKFRPESRRLAAAGSEDILDLVDRKIRGCAMDISLFAKPYHIEWHLMFLPGEMIELCLVDMLFGNNLDLLGAEVLGATTWDLFRLGIRLVMRLGIDEKERARPSESAMFLNLNLQFAKNGPAAAARSGGRDQSFAGRGRGAAPGAEPPLGPLRAIHCSVPPNPGSRREKSFLGTTLLPFSSPQAISIRW
jgi:hypothetical protein